MSYHWRRFIVLSLFVALGMLGGMLPIQTGQAKSCHDWPAIFAANRSIFSNPDSAKHVLILTFLNKTKDPRQQWLGDALRLGLFLMLEPAKNTDVIEIRTDNTSFEIEEMATIGKLAGADYVIGGEYRMGEDELIVYTRFVDVAKQKNLKLEESTIEWESPKKFSELLIHLARRASKAFKKVKVNKKTLQRAQVQARSIPALEYWTLAQMADAKGTAAGIEKAHKLYQEAIKNDFNFCYGYMGLAQTLAETGFMKKLKGKPYRQNYLMAQKELTKVALLCPETAKLWGARVTQYLEADVQQTAGRELLAEGDRVGAMTKFEEAVKILPGDVSSLKLMGSDKLAELTRCR